MALCVSRDSREEEHNREQEERKSPRRSPELYLSSYLEPLLVLFLFRSAEIVARRRRRRRRGTGPSPSAPSAHACVRACMCDKARTDKKAVVSRQPGSSSQSHSQNITYTGLPLPDLGSRRAGARGNKRKARIVRGFCEPPPQLLARKPCGIRDCQIAIEGNAQFKVSLSL